MSYKPKYEVKLVKKEKIASGTMAFYWEKPADLTYQAGNYCDMTLVNHRVTDEEETERTFSLASAPFEEHLMTATRMSDSVFKEILEDFTPGEGVKLDEPRGDFILHQNESTPAVFLIGGIGITPVRSIIAQATYDQLSHKITLLYSNETPDEAAFMADLEEYAAENSNFELVPIMTDAKPGEWEGETSLVDADMVKKYVEDVSAAIYYLCGPPGMVKDMNKMLVGLGVSEDNIRAEEFSGY